MSQEQNSAGAENFPVRLRKLRKQAGLTLAEVAAAVGRGTSTINDWEKGRTSPQPKDLERLAEALHTWPGLLQFGESPIPGFAETRLLAADRPRHFAVCEDPSVVAPIHTRPPAPHSPTRADCIEYLERYLDQAEEIPGAVARACLQLQLYLPLAELERLKQMEHEKT